MREKQKAFREYEKDKIMYVIEVIHHNVDCSYNVKNCYCIQYTAAQDNLEKKVTKVAS